MLTAKCKDGAIRKVVITQYNSELMLVRFPATGESEFITLAQYASMINGATND